MKTAYNPPQSVLKFFWQMVKPYKGWYFLMLLGPLSCGLQPLLYNYSFRNFINSLADTNANAYSIFHPVMGFVLCELYLQISWRIHNYATWQFVPYMYQDITEKVFSYVTNHSYNFFQDNLSGSIVSKVKGITDSLYKLGSALEGEMMQSLLKLLFLGIGLCLSSYEIFIMLVIFLVIKVPLAIFLFKKLSKIEENCQTDWHNLFGLIADNITNIFNLLAFATREKERKKISHHYETIHNPLRLWWHKYDFWVGVVLSSIDVLFIMFFCIYLVHLKTNNRVNIGDITFIVTSLNIFLDNIWKSVNNVKEFLQRYATAKVSFSIMEIPHDAIDIVDAKDLIVAEGNIEFHNVFFNYDKQNIVFRNLNFTIKSGQKIGLVGSSGVGKSTLVSLLMKNFKATSGDILIDGQSIYEVSSDSLRRQISYIPQDVILFHRSIAENIGYAKENCSMEEVYQAAKNAYLHNFIMSLPQQYDTQVGERGVKLSGGQRQRIAIARAFLKKSQILILDEATSALDSITEKEIQTTLWKLMQKKTCIVVAHRLSTLLEMDRILVFDDGKIVQDASHSELIVRDGIYKKLWNTQVSGFVVN